MRGQGQVGANAVGVGPPEQRVRRFTGATQPDFGFEGSSQFAVGIDASLLLWFIGSAEYRRPHPQLFHRVLAKFKWEWGKS